MERVPPTLSELDEPPRHGDARRAWNEAFLTYAYRLVEDPAYQGMPATHADDKKLDWTIPSNRKVGSVNWRGNAERRDWWRAKAAENDIDTTDGPWLSRTAKLIHPWKWKPCQICGRWMRLTYSYPGPRTVSQLNAYLPAGEQLEFADFLDIYEVVRHMAQSTGAPATASAFAKVFKPLGELSDISGADEDELCELVEDHLVSQEFRKLSPGAMSNAPDRLDGFHTYNLCCRSKQDTGRSIDNLKTYGVDRRAFEHWSEGDWEAANLLMSKTIESNCPRCGRWAQMTADHVGPISLGFRHTPFFEAVCLPCNSAKNNRMTHHDVVTLLEREGDEEMGPCATSWHAEELWNLAKADVADHPDLALRLSRLLNVNQHQFLRALLLFRQSAPDALMQFLHPEYADYRVEFVGLNRATLTYERIDREERQRTYAISKAARLVRIAFEALDEYALKERRNVATIPEEDLAAELAALEEAARIAHDEPSDWRGELILALDPLERTTVRENRLKTLMGQRYKPAKSYAYVREALETYMAKCGVLLYSRLNDENAIREWAAELESAQEADDPI